MKGRWRAPLLVVGSILALAGMPVLVGLERLAAWGDQGTRLEAFAGPLLFWRVGLYAGIAALWWCLERRYANSPARTPWRRLGLISATLILGVEASRLALR